MDERIVGVILLEPVFPPPLRHYVHHYARRLRTRESWSNVIRGKNPFWLAFKARLARARAKTTREEPEAPRSRGIRDPEVRAFMVKAYARLQERKIPALVVLSGATWYYRDSFTDAFPEVKFGKQVSISYHREADHSFTRRAERTRLIRLIVDWAESTAFERR
jgi:hypothetical protein